MRKDVDTIIFSPTLKQVDTAEYNPTEFINTNIIGSRNIVDVSLRNQILKMLCPFY